LTTSDETGISAVAPVPPAVADPAPLGLAGDTAATLWPTFASLPAVAFWPLAGCLVAGGIVFVSVLRSRPGARTRDAEYAGPQQWTSYPGQQPGG